MAVITITRGKHSGGENVAEQVAAALGARCVSDEVLREAAKQHNVPDEKMTDLFEVTPNLWERMLDTRRQYLAYVQATLAEWAAADSLVYHGNAGQELLREVPHALKIRLAYPVPFRVKRIMSLFDKSRDEAQRMVESIDEDRTRRIRYYYGQDWWDVSRYDTAIVVDRITDEEAQEIILKLVAKPEFTLDDAKRPAFDDFLLKTKVNVVLADHLGRRTGRVQAKVSGGKVTLKAGMSPRDGTLLEAIAAIENLPGAVAVAVQEREVVEMVPPEI